jgi:hypothetical protein
MFGEISKNLKLVLYTVLPVSSAKWTSRIDVSSAVEQCNALNDVAQDLARYQKNLTMKHSNALPGKM